ncbi:MAG: flagellar export protein FliJ [Firmicutes bacterium]|jgi:flagellar FliJ protein|nr:flagellar export protein FliJ [Bacillota bacterium]
MARFQFRLERLLRYRRSLEEEAKRELALRLQDLELEAAKTAALAREAEAAAGCWRNQLQARLNLPLLQLIGEYHRLTERRLEDQRCVEQQQRQRVEEQRLAVKQAWQQRRIMELLREKAQERFRREEQLAENRFLDEIVVQSHHRHDGPLRLQSAAADIKEAVL